MVLFERNAVMFLTHFVFHCLGNCESYQVRSNIIWCNLSWYVYAIKWHFRINSRVYREEFRLPDAVTLKDPFSSGSLINRNFFCNYFSKWNTSRASFVALWPDFKTLKMFSLSYFYLDKTCKKQTWRF